MPGSWGCFHGIPGGASHDCQLGGRSGPRNGQFLQQEHWIANSGGWLRMHRTMIRDQRHMEGVMLYPPGSGF